MIDQRYKSGLIVALLMATASCERGPMGTASIGELAPIAMAASMQSPQQSSVLPQGGCSGRSGEEQAWFGDLHVHTSYSIDAYQVQTLYTPEDAYAFAKGQQLIPHPEDPQGSPNQLERPLDFAAVTDHAEFMGMKAACQGPKVVNNTGKDFVGDFCPGVDINKRTVKKTASKVWKETQKAANDAYDPCSFTTFIGYEWSKYENFDQNDIEKKTLHRNVIFANKNVTKHVINSITTPTPEALWRKLDEECSNKPTKRDEEACDVLSIPHNLNFSNGLVFNTSTTSKSDLKLREKYEKLVEIFQVKGNSECLELDDSDPDCNNFEMLLLDHENPAQARRGYAREGLKTGLLEYQKLGFNPLQFGLIASSDSHNANPGDVGERSSDTILKDGDTPFDRNPGGLVGIWAEQNTREDLFAAMKRRNTFATSGPRIRIKIFQTWQDNACDNANVTADTPMGGSMLVAANERRMPKFVARVTKDINDLSRLDFIVSQTDANGDNRTQVIRHNVAKGEEKVLCHSFAFDDFDRKKPMFVYARVLETPSQRWDYQKSGRVIQERAWSSPIWYLPLH